MEKSVYNFVPAPKEKEVFTPNWANQVQHDMPFSDGETGEIEIKITAKTPIYIRNGHTEQEGKVVDEIRENGGHPQTKEEKEIWERYNAFSYRWKDNKKEFFIPATSLKGMIRNTLEIFSFSRLKTQNNEIFSFRRIDHKIYTDDQRKIKSGWLYKNENGNWKIQECKHDNISIEDIQNEFNIEISGLNSIEKYNALRQGNEFFRHLKVYFKEQLGFQKGNKFTRTTKLYAFESNDEHSIEGNLVVYGSIDNNKKREYIFHSPFAERVYSVSDDLVKKFVDIDDKLEDNESLWKYFIKNKIERIPVFFFVEEDKKDVKHFGFSKLYKRTNTKYLKELSPIKTYLENVNRKPDLATTMFGYTNDKKDKNKGLKGRVFFGHSFSKNAIETDEVKKEILAGPKASFYPYYLKGGKTYTEDSELSGFKKYPVHTNIWSEEYTPEQNENQKVFSTFRPLKSGAEFRGKVRFHNLRKIEIGALLSALTFHNHTNTYFHSLGGAKPFGYGKVQIEVSKESHGLKHELKEYLSEFENYMDYFCRTYTNNTSWSKATRIWLYLAMSMDNNLNLKYPKLENTQGNNEFKDIETLPNIDTTNVNFTELKDESLVKKYTEWDNKYQNILNKSIDKQLEFIDDFPNQIHINKLKDQIFKRLEKELNYDDLKRVFDKFPEFYDKDLEKKAKEKKIYQGLNHNDIAGLKQFLKDFPNSKHQTEIELEIDHLEKAQRETKEKETYDKLLIGNDLEELETFARNCLNDEYRKNIRERITNIQRENRAKKDEEELKKLANWEIPQNADFSKMKEILNPIAKNRAFDEFSEEEKQRIKTALLDCWAVEKAKGKKNVFFKGKKFLPITKYPWTEIKKWIDETMAVELYNKLTK